MFFLLLHLFQSDLRTVRNILSDLSLSQHRYTIYNAILIVPVNDSQQVIINDCVVIITCIKQYTDKCSHYISGFYIQTLNTMLTYANYNFIIIIIY